MNSPEYGVAMMFSFSPVQTAASGRLHLLENADVFAVDVGCENSRAVRRAGDSEWKLGALGDGLDETQGIGIQHANSGTDPITAEQRVSIGRERQGIEGDRLHVPGELGFRDFPRAG